MNKPLLVVDDNSRIAVIREGYDFGDATPALKYNLEDHLGSSTILLETNGSLINKEEYYPFGETSFGSYAKKRYRYSGKEKDEESGLYYYGARYYMPWACKFINCDPMAARLPQWSSYVGFNDNPIRYIDPEGLEGTDWVKIINKEGKSQAIYDSRVHDQASADIYQPGSNYIGPTGSYTSKGMPVTLLANGSYNYGGKNIPSIDYANNISTPETKNEPIVKGTGMTQSQIDASFNPEKEIVYGTPEAALAPLWRERAERELEIRRINEYLDNFNKGIDNLFYFSVAAGASPFVIGGGIVYGGTILSSTSSFIGSTVLPKAGVFALSAYKGIKYVAKGYHNTFGKNGGYVSFGGEVVSQTNTQLVNGNWSIGNYNAAGVLTSPFITNTNKVGGYVQSIFSANVSIGFNGETSFAFQKGTKYTAASTGIAILNENFVPIVGDAFTGTMQGAVDKNFSGR